MGCGCGKKKNLGGGTTTQRATVNATFEVYKNDRTTGRKFTSLISAQAYARSVGGEVREIV